MKLLTVEEASVWFGGGWLGLFADSASHKKTWIALSSSGRASWCGLSHEAAIAAQKSIGGEVRENNVNPEISWMLAEPEKMETRQIK